jgi:hypothetical protein
VHVFLHLIVPGSGSGIWILKPDPDQKVIESWPNIDHNPKPCWKQIKKMQQNLRKGFFQCCWAAVLAVASVTVPYSIRSQILFFITFYGLRRDLSSPWRFLLYVGRAAGFEPELVKLAALPRWRYQSAIPALCELFPPSMSYSRPQILHGLAPIGSDPTAKQA